jgi:2-isopropylmalate synthase
VATSDGATHEATCQEGDGQVDALYHALESITRCEAKLLEYTIDAVTAGKDAQGRVKVRLMVDGHEVRGIGVATDVITASVLAYLSAINRHFMIKELQESGHGQTAQPLPRL